MNLTDLLVGRDIDPRTVIVLRHRPVEPALNKVLPWLAAERPEVFNAFQATQSERLEKAMLGADHLASFVADRAGRALFVGLYRIGATRSLTADEYWSVPEHIAMKPFGFRGFQPTEERRSLLFFDLAVTDFYSEWKGKLVIGWPPPERSWWRRAHKNTFPVLAIHEDSALVGAMPDWQEISLSWEELAALPQRWQSALAQWRGIYFIFDTSDSKGYVGSAYGCDNIYGRWRVYAETGHGGNRLLRDRDPKTFRFSILQRVSPDLDSDAVIHLELTWKTRLNTRSPNGLNDN